ncbi:hypothetical protein CV093_11770 [Oceanobacillus sp. 143]|nr:hypothetical protein CV093_11770 [Oceanobacillus sp. 143]
MGFDEASVNWDRLINFNLLFNGIRCFIMCHDGIAVIPTIPVTINPVMKNQ